MPFSEKKILDFFLKSIISRQKFDRYSSHLKSQPSKHDKKFPQINEITSLLSQAHMSLNISQNNPLFWKSVALQTAMLTRVQVCSFYRSGAVLFPAFRTDRSLCVAPAFRRPPRVEPRRCESAECCRVKRTWKTT